jgi:hypothetical protein
MTAMSMNLDLQLSTYWNAKAAHHDLAAADESVLRYDVLLGDLILQINGVDFSARWGWIPLLDLAYSLKDMCDEILTGEPEAAFEFTESDAWLRFSRRGDAVEISASYVPQRTVIEMRDLCTLLTSSAQDFFTQIATENPGLASNPSFQRMRERVFATPAPKQTSGARPN